MPAEPTTFAGRECARAAAEHFERAASFLRWARMYREIGHPEAAASEVRSARFANRTGALYRRLAAKKG